MLVTIVQYTESVQETAKSHCCLVTQVGGTMKVYASTLPGEKVVDIRGAVAALSLSERTKVHVGVCGISGDRVVTTRPEFVDGTLVSLNYMTVINALRLHERDDRLLLYKTRDNRLARTIMSHDGNMDQDRLSFTRSLTMLSARYSYVFIGVTEGRLLYCDPSSEFGAYNVVLPEMFASAFPVVEQFTIRTSLAMRALAETPTDGDFAEAFITTARRSFLT